MATGEAGELSADDPLTETEAGSVIRVCDVTAKGADGVRLKRMGICTGQRIRLVQDGDPLIVLGVGARVGISRRLAETIRVVPCGECSDTVMPAFHDPQN